MLNTMKRHGITLALFAAGATGLTAVVNSLTESTIAHQAALQQKAMLDQVVPAENYDNNMQAECYVVTDSALGNMALTAFIWRAKRVSQSLPPSKLPRQMAIPALSNYWSEQTLAVTYWVVG
ncbi:electron transport complex protein RnfG [Yersinia enterocolitica]|nr:electron transport complex protein RnfG [Yersinia enterocolitica]